jgi:hypothetical protein
VLLPMIWPIGFELSPSENVQKLYSFIDKLPSGQRNLLSFDYDPASMPELHPAAIAMIAHMFEKGQRVICCANWPVGGDMADQALAEAEVYYKKKMADTKQQARELKKGVDYINLGFKPGVVIHIKRLIANFLGPYPIDKAGNLTKDMQIFKDDKRKKDGKEQFSFDDIGIIVSYTAGTGGVEAYIQLASEINRPMAAGCTSVNIPRFYTYVQTGQLQGMTGGMPGAAEYEKLTGIKGSATSGMDSQSVCHLVIILFIVLGNIAYLVERSQTARRS